MTQPSDRIGQGAELSQPLQDRLAAWHGRPLQARMPLTFVCLGALKHFEFTRET